MLSYRTLAEYNDLNIVYISFSNRLTRPSIGVRNSLKRTGYTITVPSMFVKTVPFKLSLVHNCHYSVILYIYNKCRGIHQD